jgi:hypothetical protein
VSRVRCVSCVRVFVVAGCGKSLRRLKVDGCGALTDSALTSIARLCPHLRALSGSHCPLFTDEVPPSSHLRVPWRRCEAMCVRCVRCVRCVCVVVLLFFLI